MHDGDFDETARFGIPAGRLPTIVARSDDGGVNLVFVEALDIEDSTDRPSLATGPAKGPLDLPLVGFGGAVADGSLWAIYRNQGDDSIVVRGAALNAAGNPILDFCGAGTGYFCVNQTIALDGAVPSTLVFPGHIAVGPSGQVLATYIRFTDLNNGPTDILAALDGDGLRSDMTFPPATPPSTSPALITNVGFREQIPPHFARRISPLANLAWDQGSGRVYLVSTTEGTQGSDETDIVLLTSDNNGGMWSAPSPSTTRLPPGFAVSSSRMLRSISRQAT